MRRCGVSYLYFLYTFLVLLLVMQYKMKQYSNCYCVEVNYTKIISAREAFKNQNVSLNIFNGYEFKLLKMKLINPWHQHFTLGLDLKLTIAVS